MIDFKETRLLPTVLRKEYEDDKYGYLEAIKAALEENNEFPNY